VWAELDDREPANADPRLADEGKPPACDSRYRDFIDHIMFNRRASAAVTALAETTYAVGENHYSDHCPIMVTLAA
jgi:endonuclease/exonuclease/phosphatase family metal-dependent hydrolase